MTAVQPGQIWRERFLDTWTAFEVVTVKGSRARCLKLPSGGVLPRRYFAKRLTAFRSCQLVEPASTQ